MKKYIKFFEDIPYETKLHLIDLKKNLMFIYDNIEKTYGFGIYIKSQEEAEEKLKRIEDLTNYLRRAHDIDNKILSKLFDVHSELKKINFNWGFKKGKIFPTIKKLEEIIKIINDLLK